MTVEITLSTVISLIGAVLALITFLYSRFGVELRLTERISAIEVKVSIWMKLLESALPSLGLLVKAPTHHRMDYLIDLFNHQHTTIEEACELRVLLTEYIEELKAEFVAKKEEAMRNDAPLPEGGRILHASLQLAAVIVWIELYNHEERRQEELAQRWRWRRWIAAV